MNCWPTAKDAKQENAQSTARKERGLLIAAKYNGVTVADLNRQHLTYHVQSQSNQDTHYIVRLSPIHGHAGAGTCTCYDHAHGGHRCKHQFAAATWQVSLNFAPDLAAMHNLTLEELEEKLIDQLAKSNSTRLTIMLHATQHLLSIKSQTVVVLPNHISLIIRYRTSGGRLMPHTLDAGELLTVERDGVQQAAQNSDPNVAYAWLIAHDYQVAGRKWIDAAGYLRRRKSTYTLES